MEIKEAIELAKQRLEQIHIFDHHQVGWEKEQNMLYTFIDYAQRPVVSVGEIMNVLREFRGEFYKEELALAISKLGIPKGGEK